MTRHGPLRAHRFATLLIAVLAVITPYGVTHAGTRGYRQTPFLMLVSIDGLKPEAILEAQSHGLKVPNLRALMADGIYATGVRGVLPTLTYPSHMTLITGASPDRHGIYSNRTFDPLRRNDNGCGDLVTKPSYLGMHGYLPEQPEMRSAFFMIGPHVPAGRSVGEIDMRQIAPTLARVLHVTLRDAEMEPLALGD
jgi:predicted AlkP superfamily pyrophosphatase or phosphodiesterase